jgi:hypothetical protein
MILYGCEMLCLILREEHRQGIWEQGAEENIWTEEGWSDGRTEKTSWRGTS